MTTSRPGVLAQRQRPPNVAAARAMPPPGVNGPATCLLHIHYVHGHEAATPSDADTSLGASFGTTRGTSEPSKHHALPAQGGTAGLGEGLR